MRYLLIPLIVVITLPTNANPNHFSLSSYCNKKNLSTSLIDKVKKKYIAKVSTDNKVESNCIGRSVPEYFDKNYKKDLREKINSNLMFVFLNKKNEELTSNNNLNKGRDPNQRDQSNNIFIRNLENALNSKKENRFDKLFADEALSDIKNRHNSFVGRFSKTNWLVKPSKNIRDTAMFLELLITGERLINEQQYQFESKQIISIETSKEKIINYEVLSEFSILKSIDTPLKVQISIPNSVLTGSRYDADIILEEPLGDSFISGGLIAIEENSNRNKLDPFIDLYPIGAGGLFKSVQAPLKAGNQILVGLITHPKGIISITKIVNVTEDSKDLFL